MFGKIEEIKAVNDALKRVSYNTWLVLDLDNTVMESSLELGGDQWFTSLLHHANLSEPDQELAFLSVISIYHAVQAHIRAKAVEPEIVTIINALQHIGIPVLGLTARDLSISHSTIRQLADIGIDFSNNPIEQVDGSFYEQGIIFCSGGDKGAAFKRFLERCRNQPQHVVMLDDREKHLQHVKVAVEALGISFDGLRYGFLDAKVLQFDRQTASHQLAHLKERLPPTVQASIDRLHLIPDDLPAKATASQFVHGFFDEDHHALDTPFLPQRDYKRKKHTFFRSRSVSSVLYSQAEVDLSQEDSYSTTRT